MFRRSRDAKSADRRNGRETIPSGVSGLVTDPVAGKCPFIRLAGWRGSIHKGHRGGGIHQRNRDLLFGKPDGGMHGQSGFPDIFQQRGMNIALTNSKVFFADFKIKEFVLKISRMNFRFWSGQNKESERYYLFPGMGGSAGRRKHRRILWWSIIAGLCVSAAVAAIMFLLNRGGK